MNQIEQAYVNEIINYMWDDELKDWEECGKPKTNHIFLSLKALKKMIE